MKAQDFGKLPEKLDLKWNIWEDLMFTMIGVNNDMKRKRIFIKKSNKKLKLALISRNNDFAN